MGSYRERLLVPVSYWLLAVPVVATLGAEAYFFVDGFIPPLVIGALFAVVAAFLVHWSSATIEVTGAELRAGKDTLALGEAGEVIALDERQAKALGGPRADPAAYFLLRPYLKRAVYISLAVPAEEEPAEGEPAEEGPAEGRPAARVPYWLVATRHPAELAAAIESARHGSRQSGDCESVG
jgi:DUF3093 family protein